MMESRCIFRDWDSGSRDRDRDIQDWDQDRDETETVGYRDRDIMISGADLNNLMIFEAIINYKYN